VNDNNYCGLATRPLANAFTISSIMNLEKMVKVTRALKAGLTKKSQKSIKRLLTEIQKMYNIIVKTF